MNKFRGLGQPISEQEASTVAENKSKTSNLEKERRIFTSLSYIIVTYLLCWSPFHIIFDILYVDENGVSYDWYSFASLRCYMNSTLNPLLYACVVKRIQISLQKHITSQAL